MKPKRDTRATHPKIKLLRGTFDKRHDAGKMDLEGMKNIPVAPEHYAGEVKETWYAVCGALYNVGLLQVVGLPQIRVFCDAFNLYLDCQEDLKKNGIKLKVVSKNGSVVIKRNPAIETAQMAVSSMNGISDRFGFSPLAQARIKNAVIPKDVDKTGEEEERYKF